MGRGAGCVRGGHGAGGDPLTGDILDAIDRALYDGGVSADAMRWAPELRCPGTVRIAFSLDTTVLAEGMRRASEDLRRLGEQASKGLAKMGGQLTAALKPTQIAAHKRMGHDDRLDRIRCRVCNPRGNPKPSPHGAAYRRRRRGRYGS